MKPPAGLALGHSRPERLVHQRQCSCDWCKAGPRHPNWMIVNGARLKLSESRP